MGFLTCQKTLQQGVRLINNRSFCVHGVGVMVFVCVRIRARAQARWCVQGEGRERAGVVLPALVTPREAPLKVTACVIRACCAMRE